MYLKNIKLWLQGFGKLDQLTYKPGWNKYKFFFLYLLDHGTHVILSGGAVVSWSRWFYETRKKYKSSKFLTRLLNWFDDNHGAEAPSAYWNSEPCPPRQRAIIALTWTVLFILYFIWR
jgi:hypothetical protein